MFGGKSLPAKTLGAPFYLVQNFLRPYLSRRRQAKSGDLLVVDIKSWVGLFAHMEWFLEISLHCELNSLKPCFMSSSPQYVDPSRGSDWFAQFFRNLLLTPEDEELIANGRIPICRIDGVRQLGLPVNYDSQLNLRTAPQLVRKYIGIKPGILSKVDAFTQEKWGSGRILGVHYRGTDKRAEAPVIPYSSVRDVIVRFLSDNEGFDRLFVSSDEQGFVRFLENELGSKLPVFSHDDQERSRRGIAVHRSRLGDRFRKAEEAILNSLLLSRCDVLIKTPSILSGWSKLFNPRLVVILLASPYQGQLWFPDRDLLAETHETWMVPGLRRRRRWFPAM